MLHKLCSSGDKGTFRQTDSKYIVAKKRPRSLRVNTERIEMYVSFAFITF